MMLGAIHDLTSPPTLPWLWSKPRWDRSLLADLNAQHDRLCQARQVSVVTDGHEWLVRQGHAYQSCATREDADTLAKQWADRGTPADILRVEARAVPSGASIVPIRPTSDSE